MSKKGFFRRTVEFALDRDVDEEIDRQKAIIERFPDRARAAFDLGVLLTSQRRRQEAIRMFEHAIELDPMMARGHESLGELYVILDRPELARTAAARAAALGRPRLLEMLERYGVRD